MRIFVKILVIALMITYSLGLSATGSWLLTDVSNGTVDNQTVTLQINSFVFKEQQILQKLSFKGCREMLLQSSFSGKNIFVNFKSYYSQPIPNVTCPNSKKDLLGLIYTQLNNVFTFSIKSDVLSFYSPTGKSLIAFRRVASIKALPSISGIWNLKQFGNVSTSVSVQISKDQIVFCQGYSVYNYTIDKDKISFKAFRSSCPSSELPKIFQQSVYYRLWKGVLLLFDKQVSQTMQMIYSNDYDPKKPLFDTSKNIQVPVLIPMANATATIPPKISTSNLAGNWTIVTLFKTSFPKTPYFLTFSNKQIVLKGGCKTYTYQYTLNSTTQIISIGALSTSNKSCSASDDQLFTSGIVQMYKYLISNSNGVATLNIYDQKGNSGYVLTTGSKDINISSVTNTNTVNSSPKATVSPAVPKMIDVLANGTYLMLLLKRRDLPRVMATISGNTVTYKLCNNIKHFFKIATPNANISNVTLTGGAITTNNCSKSNDGEYYNALNEVNALKYDDELGVIIFSKQGTDTVTFSRTY